jgi:hypothetical protein
MSSSALNLDFNLFFSSPFSPCSSEKSSNSMFVKSGGFPMIG